ncbi:hypothetical protein IEQ34_019162 [Dendrobium chrysotoxum]|uniref:C2H2-type domain-containing protein n=1 Tax=Dendrobium chrysotoxum TaxID=161865 RepID=A0AAV7G966_DENCH|nr:hypothetical protein IEQ34_019162 [Dendrobium chrysotoxum]
MKPFTNSECLKAHIQSCHKYVKCEICGAQQLRKNFKRHQRTHEGVISKERIKCSFQGCEQSFSKKSNLNKHVKAVHEELRPFRCRTSGCQQRFPYKHVRDNHEKTHVYVQENNNKENKQLATRKNGTAAWGKISSIGKASSKKKRDNNMRKNNKHSESQQQGKTGQQHEEKQPAYEKKWAKPNKKKTAQN